MTLRRCIVPVGIAVSFVLASCGGSDSSDPETGLTTVATTEAETEPTEDFTLAEDEPDQTEADATDAVAADTSDGAVTETDPEPGGSDVVGEAVSAGMTEWQIDAPTEYTAGDVTFTATNNGNFPHEFVVIRGDGYESLPLEDGGAVIEDELPPGALLDRTDKVGGGSSADLTVTLEAGNYVLLCNLGGGSNSHAGKGQTLDITVS